MRAKSQEETGDRQRETSPLSLLLSYSATPYETQPYLSDGVVLVRIYQDYRLPGSQCEAPFDHGDHGRRCDDARHHVVGAVSGRSVPMAVEAVVPRQHGIERVHQVVVAACARFDHSDTRGCVRDEYVEQAVTLACNESRGIGCEVEDAPPVPGLDREDLSVHRIPSDVLALEYLTHRRVSEDGVDCPRQDRPDREHGDLV